MRINPIIYSIIVLVVFFGIIAGFQSAGIWSVSGKVDNDGQAIQPSASDINTIKGWMTLEQIATTYNVPIAELLSQFALPADTLTTESLSSLENDTFSVSNLRTWLQSRSAVISDTPVAPAVQIPTDLSPTISNSSSTASPVSTPPAQINRTITGKTTFQDLLDWGVSVESIQRILSGDLPEPATIIKDFVASKGLEFSSLKTQLQNEVDLLNQ